MKSKVRKVYLAIGLLAIPLQVAMIGKERKPITPGQALTMAGSQALGWWLVWWLTKPD